MLRKLTTLSVAICALSLPIRPGPLVTHGRVESLPGRDFAHRPISSYQAGYVFSIDGSHTSIRVDSVDSGNNTSIDLAVTLPDSFRVSLAGVAVSFEGEIAVVADAMDRDGRLTSAIAWLDDDGSPVRIVRTSPFAATDIGFTADGSLWAAGVEKISRDEAHPSHDVIRQYDAKGQQVLSLLSREQFSTDSWHPATDSFLATSRHYIAFVSREARTWTLITSSGVIAGHGSINVPGDYKIVSGAVTDSGRIFINGRSPGDARRSVWEISSGVLSSIDTSGLSNDKLAGHLVGSDGENLVLFSNTSHQFTWLAAN